MGRRFWFRVPGNLPFAKMCAASKSGALFYNFNKFYRVLKMTRSACRPQRSGSRVPTFRD